MEETITITKTELTELIRNELRKKIEGKKRIGPNFIFIGVSIGANDFHSINQKYDAVQRLSKPYRDIWGVPLSLKKYPHGMDSSNYKASEDVIHEHLRKLSLSVFGVTRNADLSTEEYELASETYQELKECYLDLYEKRISSLSADDFEN